MPNEWILDVLTDLRLFAEQNGLSSLADQLDDTVLVAATEIASVGSSGGTNQKVDNGYAAIEPSATIAAGDNA